MGKKKMSTEMREILSKVPEDKKSIAGRLADELIFLQETLDDLRNQVRENGTIDHFVLGSQSMLRESPALRSYNNTLKQYSSLYKQLTDLLPKEETTQRANQLYEFLKEGK